ncbi:MAG: hypothetical protein IPO83_06010 [Chitinophagaceae bacterium]|nr:hypothetical protein [Chitinophagaceae bacterium]
MKLRFDKNSLRLRLKKSDIEKLRNDNSVHEKIPFLNGSFEYRLLIAPDQPEVAANLEAQSITVVIPTNIALTWMNNNEVGIYHTIHIDENRNLDIILEKDFPCKEIPEEDQQDYFTPDDIPIPPNQC